ncbi:MAG TPA: hypothetical protein VEX15_10605 [Nocardioidaceae bacterium]|nr:hypothetical protein [Nocardioidaceae bacterium]
MNNKALTRKATVAGVVGLTAAGLTATIALANDPAADTADSKAVERQESAFAQQYTGPGTADAAEAWIESEPAYTGPRTADAAEGWLGSGAAHSSSALQCVVTADAAEHWIAGTGHLPCAP